MNSVIKAGASHQITDRAPPCPHHNIMTSKCWLNLVEYREGIAYDGKVMVGLSVPYCELFAGKSPI